MTYDPEELFVCNLKKLGTNLDEEQKDIKFIMARMDFDLGYECSAGRYSSIFWEAITHFEVETIKSSTKITNPPYNTGFIYNAEPFDINLLTEDEISQRSVTDLRLLQIYNQINFEKQAKKQL